MIYGNTASSGKFVDAPTSISATGGDGQATISFTAAAHDGKGVATYQVVSSPSALTASGSSSPIVITGLSNGTAYTFTVTTVSGYGINTVSVSSNSVTPAAAGGGGGGGGGEPPPPPPPDPCAGAPLCTSCNASPVTETQCFPGGLAYRNCVAYNGRCSPAACDPCNCACPVVTVCDAWIFTGIFC